MRDKFYSEFAIQTLIQSPLDAAACLSLRQSLVVFASFCLSPPLFTSLYLTLPLSLSLFAAITFNLDSLLGSPLPAMMAICVAHTVGGRKRIPFNGQYLLSAVLCNHLTNGQFLTARETRRCFSIKSYSLSLLVPVILSLLN